MPVGESTLSVGQLAQRGGLAVSALHYYERLGLISALRSTGNQRRYPKAMLRRVAFIRAAQQLGIPLADIGAALQQLPAQRTPTKADWSRLSAGWRAQLDARIVALQALRDRLDGCIGCGCLSLRACALYNPDDACGQQGSGAQRLGSVNDNPMAPASRPGGQSRHVRSLPK